MPSSVGSGGVLSAVGGQLGQPVAAPSTAAYVTRRALRGPSSSTAALQERLAGRVDGVAERAGEARAAGGRCPRHVGVAEPDPDLVELQAEQFGGELRA